MSEALIQSEPADSNRLSAPEIGGVAGGVIGLAGGVAVAVKFEGMKINAGTDGYEAESQTGSPPMAESDVVQVGTMGGLLLVGIAAGVAIARRLQNRGNRSYPDAINTDA